MPRRRTPAQDETIAKVIESDKEMKQAHALYKKAQDKHLSALRDARSGGETLENLADALNVSKQWVHKWTTFGHDHNKVGYKSCPPLP